MAQPSSSTTDASNGDMGTRLTFSNPSIKKNENARTLLSLGIMILPLAFVGGLLAYMTKSTVYPSSIDTWMSALSILGVLALVCAMTMLFCMLVLYVMLTMGRPRAITVNDIHMIRASPFTTQSEIPSDLDTIVIGSGSGGSTCATLLAHQGQRVLVLDQHSSKTGGCTHSFRQQECEWDTGLHYTSRAMSDPTARAGALMHYMTCGTQEWTPLADPYDQIVFPPHPDSDSTTPQADSTTIPNSDDTPPPLLVDTNNTDTAASNHNLNLDATSNSTTTDTHTDDAGTPNVTNGKIMTDMEYYNFVSGKEATMESILQSLPHNDQIDMLRERMRHYFDLCLDIHTGFTALGISRLLPRCLHSLFGLQAPLDRLYQYARFTVRDVQYAIFNAGFTPNDILQASTLPTAPNCPDPDPIRRRLKGTLCHPIGDYAVQPREATMAAHGVTMAHYINGASYTVGATMNMTQRMASVVRARGGEVYCNATVQRILVEHGRSVGVQVVPTKPPKDKSKKDKHETKDSAAESSEYPVRKDPPMESTKPPVPMEPVIIRAKHIVCATSVYNLYHKFLPPELPVVQEFMDPKQRSIQPSHGHIFLFCKLQGDADQLNLPKHNLWYFHRHDLDTAFDDYFARPIEVRPPTVYIGFPCMKDTTWKRRFPGISNCLLISDGLYEWFEEWKDEPCKKRSDAYKAYKDKLSQHLLDILYETVPQVRGKITYHHLGTPLTEINYLGSYHAGSYGTQCTPDMFAPMNRTWTTTPHTRIPGLYMAGSDAFLPSVVGAMYGGGLGACAVLGYAGSMRLAMDVLSHMAAYMRSVDPQLGYIQSWKKAVRAMMDGE
jgi:phytoene dehydrogenase-like protein